MPTSSTSNDVAHALVLTWNGAHLLGDCLRALLPQAARVTVVDNASTDGTAELLRREFPRVEHLILSGNFGFGRANNEGIRLALDAGAEFVALLNNDVEVAPGWLDRLLAAARARPRAGLFTGTLLFRGGAGFAGDGRSPKGG
ncbi:MAG TPA: glycosyltransferase, partial [Myxococcales bacterium]|nr:glycosyltransferase [Myxococcales bacterium]